MGFKNTNDWATYIAEYVYDSPQSYNHDDHDVHVTFKHDEQKFYEILFGAWFLLLVFLAMLAMAGVARAA